MPVTASTGAVTPAFTSWTASVTLSTVGATSTDGRICVLPSIEPSGIVTVGGCTSGTWICVRGVVVSGADGASGAEGAPGTAGADPPPTGSPSEAPAWPLSPEAAGAEASR